MRATVLLYNDRVYLDKYQMAEMTNERCKERNNNIQIPQQALIKSDISLFFLSNFEQILLSTINTNAKRKLQIGSPETSLNEEF